MTFGSVRTEGGHQPEDAWDDMAQRLGPQRESPRCMYPSEFLRILKTYKRPKFVSCGVEVTRFGNQPRKEFGIGEHGTIWLADASSPERRWLFAIPTNCIPYNSIRTAIWDESKLRWVRNQDVPEDIPPTLTRGWRRTFEDLLEHSYLEPHPYISWLIGKDARKVVPREFWT